MALFGPKMALFGPKALLSQNALGLQPNGVLGTPFWVPKVTCTVQGPP